MKRSCFIYQICAADMCVDSALCEDEQEQEAANYLLDFPHSLAHSRTPPHLLNLKGRCSGDASDEF